MALEFDLSIIEILSIPEIKHIMPSILSNITMNNLEALIRFSHEASQELLLSGKIHELIKYVSTNIDVSVLEIKKYLKSIQITDLSEHLPRYIC